MINAQEWLESQEEYKTKEKRELVTWLSISNKGLEGSLNLTDFINLTHLDCSDNKLTELDLTGLTQLEKIKCSKNYLTKFDYSSLNSEKLTYLSINNNNLSKQDLSAFSQLVNLEILGVGNDDKERINQDIYNRFTGSLEPLKNLTKLEKLHISNTDIDSGLKYLSDNIEELSFSIQEREESKVSKIYEQLNLYNLNIKKYVIWKKNEKEWEKRGFNYEQVKGWINAGLEPSEAGLAYWLREEKSKDIENFDEPNWVKNNAGLEKLRTEYKEWLEKRNNNWKEHGNPLLDFTEEITREWMKLDFSKEQCREWINIGMKSSDSSFCAWLRDEVKLELLEVLNNMNIENSYQEADLREQFREYSEEKNKKSTWQLILKLRDKGFGWKEIEELVNSGLKSDEINYVFWLKNNKKVGVLEYKNSEELRKEYLISRWYDKGFTDEEISAWISVGLELKDSSLAVWMRDIKKMNPFEYLSKSNAVDAKKILYLLKKEMMRTYTKTEEIAKVFNLTTEETQNLTKRKEYDEEQAEDILYGALKVADLLVKIGQVQRGDKSTNNPLRELLEEKNKNTIAYRIVNDKTNKSIDRIIAESLSKKINAQEWLDKHYPKKSRKSIPEIYLDEPSLEGELDLRDFTRKDGVKVLVSSQVDETKLTFKNLPEKAKITKLIQFQEYINRKYPIKEERKSITELDIGSQVYKNNNWEEKSNWKKLEGELDLSDFVNLKRLDCCGNKLTSLNINNCLQLEEIDCFDNQLTNLDVTKNDKIVKFDCQHNWLTNLGVSNCSHLTEFYCSWNLLTNVTLPDSSINLKKLDLSNNNFSATQNLFFLTRAINLEELRLGNHLNQERIKNGIYNRFTGSLDYLSGMQQLKYLEIYNIDINEVNIDKLPRSLEEVKFGEEVVKRRSDCKIITIISQLEKCRWGFCKNKKCQQPNTSKNWCQFCVEREWQKDIKNLSRQELVKKFIQQQQSRKIKREEMSVIFSDHSLRARSSNSNVEIIYDDNGATISKINLNTKDQKSLVERTLNTRQYEQFRWIPYEQFTNIEYLARGGFSKIYKAKWERERKQHEEDYVVLKFLNNSQNITLEFLTEIANNRLINEIYEGISNSIVECYGISQDPISKDFVIVMQYMKEGNLRQTLQNKIGNLSLKKKLTQLWFINHSLYFIHKQSLTHGDLHSGNILSHTTRDDNSLFFSIADLGLCQPANHQKEKGKIFGILPYIAPEVLRGQPYTQASDIYSFGVIAYELLANAYPYYDYYQKGVSDKELIEKIRKGLRPNIDELKIPQLLKDLIKRCWNNNPKLRPRAEELSFKIIRNWIDQIGEKYWSKENTEFYRQYQALKDKYNHFSINTPYRIHPNTIAHSQLINTQQIAQLFQESKEQALDQEIKKMEREIDQPLTAEQKELVSNFMQTKKLTIQDEADEQAEDKAWELEDQLKDQGLSQENIEKIMKYCERFIKVEQKLAEEQLETNIEIPTNK